MTQNRPSFAYRRQAENLCGRMHMYRDQAAGHRRTHVTHLISVPPAARRQDDGKAQCQAGRHGLGKGALEDERRQTATSISRTILCDNLLLQMDHHANHMPVISGRHLLIGTQLGLASQEVPLILPLHKEGGISNPEMKMSRPLDYIPIYICI